jgi:hypothetical protein
MHLPAPTPAYPATQQPRSQTVNGNRHLLPSLFHLRHSVSFQSQLFSDKRLDEHLVSVPFRGLSNSRKHTDRGALFSSNRLFPKAVFSAYTFGTRTQIYLCGKVQSHRIVSRFTVFEPD